MQPFSPLLFLIPNLSKLNMHEEETFFMCAIKLRLRACLDENEAVSSVDLNEETFDRELEQEQIRVRVLWAPQSTSA